MLLVLAAALLPLTPVLTAMASAAPPTSGVYQINQPIANNGTWSVTLNSVVVTGNVLGVVVDYQNESTSPQNLYCPNAKQSILVGGQTIMQLDSYCAQHVGATWTVPAKSKFPSWATFPTLPDQLTAFTLNNWFGWGSVQNIQLVPFVCLQGPGGSCLGVPRQLQADQMPTPPEWLTSATTGGCVLSLATAGLGKYYEELYLIWIEGLGGAIRIDESNNKLYVLLNSAIPFKDCREILGGALLPVAQQLLPSIKGLPFLTETT